MKKILSTLGLLAMLTPLTALAYTPPPEALNAVITQEATKYGVDPELAESIAWCENHAYKVDQKHWNTNGTKDVGIFQINDVHIPELEKLGLTRYDATDNVKFAMILLSSDGTSDFTGSESCWSELY